MHIVCEHCGFLDEEHHITPGAGGFFVTLMLLFKALERGHMDDIPEILQLVIVEAVYILHTFFTGFFKFFGVRNYDSLAYTLAMLVFILAWTIPGLVAWQLGHGLTGVALGLISVFIGTNITLKAVGTHI